MSDYKKTGGFGGNRGGNRDFAKKDFGGRQSFGGNRGGDRGGRPSQMFSAICDECKKPCEVPFRPSGEKPVYCSNCFGAKREGGNNDYQKRDYTPAPSRAPMSTPSARPVSDDFKNQFNSLNAKLDKLIEMMSKNVSKNIAPVAPIQKVAPVVVLKKEIKKVAVPLKKVVAKKEIKKVIVAPKKVVAKVVSKKKIVTKKK